MRASCYRFRAVFKNHLKSSLRLKFLLGLMMANIHYNRITRLEKGENNCPMDIWSVQNRHKTRKKLDYCLKQYLILNKLEVLCIYGHINPTVAVPSFPYNFTMQAHNLWFLWVLIANEFIATIVTSLQTKQRQQTVQIISFTRSRTSRYSMWLLMQWLIHVKTPAQTCLQNTELTLESFGKSQCVLAIRYQMN